MKLETLFLILCLGCVSVMVAIGLGYPVPHWMFVPCFIGFFVFFIVGMYFVCAD